MWAIAARKAETDQVLLTDKKEKDLNEKQESLKKI